MFEYDYFDGDHFITFDIIEVDEDNSKITLAISNQGRITQDTFDLLMPFVLFAINLPPCYADFLPPFLSFVPFSRENCFAYFLSPNASIACL